MTSTQPGDATVDEALSRLLKRLGGLDRRLSKLRDADPDAKVEFHLAVVSDPNEIALFFRAETINGVAAFGGSLDVEYSNT